MTLPAIPGAVRPAIPADTRALAELHVRAWRWAYRDLLPAPYLASLSAASREQMWRRSLTDPASPTRVLVWDDAGALRGFSAHGPARDDDPGAAGAGQLLALYLDEPLVGRGAGRALHDAALDGLRAAGFPRATLWVLEHNALALAFYTRRGWAPDGHRKLCPFGDEHRPELRLARRL